MLTLFSKDPNERPPSVKDVEQKMGITLSESPLEPDDLRIRLKQFVISGTPYVDLEARRFGLGDHYYVSRARYPGQTIQQHLRLFVSPKQTGFCLDPYELAVYTGSTFVNGDSSPHAKIREWPPAYVWGMFMWSNTGRYIGQDFNIVVGQSHDTLTQKVNRAGCVGAISVSGKYQEWSNQ
jgi:hypothetical protein